MRSGGNSFNYFQLTKLANFVQFKRMLVFSWGLEGLRHLVESFRRRQQRLPKRQQKQ